jgi:hypothetical protein
VGYERESSLPGKPDQVLGADLFKHIFKWFWVSSLRNDPIRRMFLAMFCVMLTFSLKASR